MLAALAVVVLTAGTRIEADLKGGEVHTYEVDLAAGTYLALHFDQRGIDIRDVITAPDGAVLIDLDTGEWGDEPAYLVARAAGRYRVEARAAETRAPQGRYVVTVETIRAATPRDEEWARAMALQVRGYAALVRRTPDALVEAREWYAQARAAWKAAGNLRGEADAVTALGFIANWADDFRGAVALEEEDVALRRTLGDEYGEARAVANLGRGLRTLGESARSIELFEQALARHRAAGRDGNAAEVLRDLSVSARMAGDYGTALERGYEAVAIARRRADTAREGSLLDNLTPIHAELGELDQAIAAARRSIELAPDDETVRARARAQIGLALARLGDFDAAEQSLNEALSVWSARGWRASEANTLRFFGESYVLRGDDERARDAFARAAVKSAEAGFAAGEAAARQQEGAALLRLGRLDDADRALAAAADRLTGADPLPLAIVWARQARVKLERHDIAAARERAEAAMGVFESVRGRAASARVRSAMLASSQLIYQTLIDVLMAQHAAEPNAGFDRAAFTVAERARARSLLELLLDDRGSNTTTRQRPAIGEMRLLHRRINAKASALDSAGQAGNRPLAATLRRELDELIDEYGLLEGRLRGADLLAAEPEPLPLEVIQRTVLDDRTVLVEYALGEVQSYAWVVTPALVRTARLASRKEIVEAVRVAQDAVESRRPAAAVDAALGRVGALLLAPLGPLPAGTRLLIVAAGALQQVPFAALPLGDGERVIARHVIVHAPSASVLGAVREATAARPRAAKSVALFADPVFDPADPRAPKGLSPTRSELTRLPFTRVEAEAIAAMVPPQSRRVAMGFDASIQAVTDPALADYRIVHFATHGILDTRTPELSGLALSMVGKDGRPRDGFLRLHDVTGMHLNADLVVLSGCETARGREVEGEGVIGLTRGFVIAGASRVVASLWKVDDLATAELMTRFYRAMLQRHLPPAAALAVAQRQLASLPQWRHPYFWAGLVMQGEWR